MKPLCKSHLLNGKKEKKFLLFKVQSNISPKYSNVSLILHFWEKVLRICSTLCGCDKTVLMDKLSRSHKYSFTYSAGLYDTINAVFGFPMTGKLCRDWYQNPSLPSLCMAVIKQGASEGDDVSSGERSGQSRGPGSLRTSVTGDKWLAAVATVAFNLCVVQTQGGNVSLSVVARRRQMGSHNPPHTHAPPPPLVESVVY